MKKVVIISATLSQDKSYHDDLLMAIKKLGFEPVVVSATNASSQIDQINESHRIIIAGVPFHYPAESAQQLASYLESWLPVVKVPVLGICLGHQALGLLFGATIRRNEETEKGLCAVRVLKEHVDNSIFMGLGPEFSVFSFHWASISLKNTSRLLTMASSLPQPGISNGCKNLIGGVIGQKMYGVQFHPEKSLTGQVLLNNFLQQDISVIAEVKPTTA